MAFLTVVFVTTNSHALSIKNMRVGTYPDKTRLVLDLDSQPQFQSFVLANPSRIVVDLPKLSWSEQAIANSAKAGITGIRQGAVNNGISRLVFDLNHPVKIKSAFTLPAGSSKPPRLVIDFAKTTSAGQNASLSNKFGSLNNKASSHKVAANIPAVKPPAPKYTPPPKPPATAPKKPKGKPLIIIDPGHGGIDPGAIGANGIYEKDVALALAKELKKQLEASGKYKVKMTRNDDTFIRLSNRVKFARKHKGDLFVSIHADSLRDPGVSGASVYTLSEKASDAQTAKLAARENKADLIAGIELEVEDAAVMDILVDLARRNTQNQSKYFANTLVSQFQSASIKTLTRPHRFANFAVLKAPEIPSVLVEAGFMSNKKEAKKLNTTAHRRKIAQTLKKGIDSYFKTVKENERS